MHTYRAWAHRTTGGTFYRAKFKFAVFVALEEGIHFQSDGYETFQTSVRTVVLYSPAAENVTFVFF